MKSVRSKLIFFCTLLLALAGVGIERLQSGAPVAMAKSMESVVAAPVNAPDVAAIPTAFSYQGFLRLADGSLATGSYDITLKIYTTVTGGAALYTESFANTVVNNGNFSVIVGDTTPIAAGVFDNANLYIGVTVAPDPEMLPRQRLYPVPWAMQAGQAALADAATTLVKDATVDGIIINKGATNEGALKVTSSGPGWGSGIRFQNTAANRTYGIYVAQDGIWHFADDTAGADRFFVGPLGEMHTRQNFIADGPIHSNSNVTADGFISAAGNVVAQGKVVASQGFSGNCTSQYTGGNTIICNNDVAETFATDQQTEPGDLVVFTPEDRDMTAVRLSTEPYEPMIVGVVSTNPGLVFDQGQTYLAGDNANLITDEKTVVAMVGRVPTKFSLENGSINIGDPLTSSSTPGVAMKATQAGQIIGYAMQSSDAAEEGKLLVWLQIGTYVPQEMLAALNSGAAFEAGGADLSAAALQAKLAELTAQVDKLQAAQQ
ncbi:MAG: hypothetical protein KDE50_13955 [Caldilineaceae bacterium]|nr:hypothetical protein [Caldilineaceae bacterium]